MIVFSVLFLFSFLNNNPNLQSLPTKEIHSSVCETAEWLQGSENTARVKTGVSDKWVKYHFGVYYPFKPPAGPDDRGKECCTVPL